MKPWPPDHEAVYFSDLVDPLTDLLRLNYRLKGKTLKLPPYKGYDIGQHDKAAVPPPDEDLTKDGLEYHKGQGRDLIDAALGTVFRLGMEQGRREVKREVAREVKYLERVLETGDKALLQSVIEMMKLTLR